MKILCGDDCGTVKLVSVKISSTSVEDQWGEIHPRHAIRRMDWSDRDSDNRTEFFTLHETGTISFQYITGHDRFSIKTRRNDIVDVFSFHPQSDGNRVIVYVTNTGNLVTTKINLQDIMREEKKFETSTSDLNVKLGKIECASLSFDHNEVAFGGREEVVKVWDLTKGREAWCSENIPPDNYGIPNPIWESDVSFGDSKFFSNHQNNFICTCTRHHELRFYDRRVGKREVYRNSWGEHAYTRIISSPHKPYEFVAGNAIGRICRWDEKVVKENVVFKNLNFSGVNVYKAAVGSIRDLSFAGLNNEFICCVGVDRYLRIFDYKTKAQKWAAYLWKKQNCLLVIDNDKEEEKDGKKRKRKEATNNDDDEEEISKLQPPNRKRKLD